MSSLNTNLRTNVMFICMYTIDNKDALLFLESTCKVVWRSVCSILLPVASDDLRVRSPAVDNDEAKEEKKKKKVNVLQHVHRETCRSVSTQ